MIKIGIFLKLLKRSKNRFSLFLTYLKLKESVIQTQTGEQVFVRPNGIDYWIYIENLVIDSYELFKLKKKKFKSVLDIGSNIGLFSVYAHSLWPKAKFINVEPNPASLVILQKNFNLNNIRSTTIAKAVSNKDNQFIKLYFNENPAMASTKVGSGSAIKVKTISLKSLVKLIEGPSLLKLDIEGAEYQLFTKENDIHFKKFNTILMELHDLNSKNNSSHVIKYFHRIGFRVEVNGRLLSALHED